MGSVSLVLVHGWGFDAGFWAPLIKALKALEGIRGGIEIVAEDMGFFGTPVSARPDPLSPVVAVGHSLGLLWLLKKRPFSWQGLVSISGMPRFTWAEDYPAGVPARILERMIARFSHAPQATLEDFHQRCGAPDDQLPALARADFPSLGSGLGWLENWDARDSFAQEKAPILSLSAHNDLIVPFELSRTLFSERKNVRFSFDEEGGHALPLTRPEYCAKEISKFLEALS